LDDGIEEQSMFMRDIEDVREIPFGLHAMRRYDCRVHNKSYLVQLICFSCTFEVIPESLRKRLHQDLNRIKAIFPGELIAI